MLVNLGKGRYIINTNEDPCARAAMEAYADNCDATNPLLALGIRAHLQSSGASLTCIQTALRIVSSAHEIGRSCEDYSAAAWNQVLTTLKSLASTFS